MLDNSLLSLLTSLKLVDQSALYSLGPCRDRDDVEALRCARSGIIVLSRTDHISLSHYEEKDGVLDAVDVGGVRMLPPLLDDAVRRARTLGGLTCGKNWLDFGTGDGAILDVLGPTSASAVGVELNAELRARAIARGHTVYHSVENLGEARFDIITLFHVFEHIVDPISLLVTLRRHLAPGGSIIIEVPHARDALLTLYDCEAFRRFTLWSEHLILHTRESLGTFLTAAGLRNLTIKGIQRYPAVNHMHWLRYGMPGGQKAWPVLADEVLANAYEAALQSADMTDTLIAFVGA